MSGVEQYLKRATRGLWGQKKRDAVTELRGAIEDKIWRHRLGGLSALEAEKAALRDLGSPTAVARDLNALHTAPQVARMTLFLGITGFLGLQAIAQVQPITSAYTRDEIQNTCHVVTPTELQTSSKALQEQYRKYLASYGGPDAFVRKCRAGDLPLLVKVTDILGALKAGDIDVGFQTDSTSTSPLVLSTSKISGPRYDTTDIGGERYISTSDLIAFLTFGTTEPLHLTGTHNPVLHVGKVGLQLGTNRAPIHATNVVAGLILRGLGGLNQPRPGDLAFGMDGGPVPVTAPSLALPGQDGEMFAIFQNFEHLKGNSADWLMVRVRTNGTVPIAFQPVSPAPLLVTTLAELNAATARKENAVMVYRVNATDLRRITLAQVPVSQLRLMPKGN